MLLQSPFRPLHDHIGKDTHCLAVATLHNCLMVRVTLRAIERLEVCVHCALVGDIKYAHTLLPGV